MLCRLFWELILKGIVDGELPSHHKPISGLILTFVFTAIQKDNDICRELAKGCSFTVIFGFSRPQFRVTSEDKEKPC